MASTCEQTSDNTSQNFQAKANNVITINKFVRFPDESNVEEVIPDTRFHNAASDVICAGRFCTSSSTRDDGTKDPTSSATQDVKCSNCVVVQENIAYDGNKGGFCMQSALKIPETSSQENVSGLREKFEHLQLRNGTVSASNDHSKIASTGVNADEEITHL